MATNFPVSVDTSTTIPAEGATIPLSTNHVTAHQNIQDAIEAIEAKVGADSSAVTTSHDYKLGEVTSTDKAVGKTATQTLTNKTLTAAKVPLGSDAVGDMRFTSNADGTQTRIAVGSDNFILKLNGTTPGWEAETVTVDATSTTAGIVELATAAEITAGTPTGGDGPLVVTPDQLALSTPVFNGSGLTNITTSFASSVQNVSGITTATNTDTTVTVGFTAKIIEIHFKMTGRNNAGAVMTTTGIAHYDGTTLKSVTYFQNNETSATTYSYTINSTAPKAGDNDGSGNGIDITLSVNSVSSTQVVVRLVSTKTGSPTAATADFSLRAWK